VSTYRLDRLFAPRSIALVGGSPRPASLGRVILQNLRQSGFSGPIAVVNPRHGEIDGTPTTASIAALPFVPDLAVLATPPRTIPGLVAEAGAKGVPAAVIVSAGLGHGPGSWAEAARLAARQHGLRIVGPNSLGVVVPRAGLGASFAAHVPKPGDLALLSQSGAVAAGLMEWAAKRAFGFSAIVSLGDKIDVDFGDCLDYFALDRATRAILIYVESISTARKFMSAARAASRVKPVVVVKSGRHAQGAKAAATHTGALAGSDAVYDAAFRRAGLLRVFDLDELFAATETLGRLQSLAGNRLSILTNGGGVGVLAVDRLVDLGGVLADLSPALRQRLDAVLPPAWSGGNPVDIIGDADAGRYAAALEAILNDRDSDAVMVINVPTALASANDSAQAVVATVAATHARSTLRKPVFAVWLGEDPVAAGLFDAARIPHYGTEADAVGGFMHLVRYAEARAAAMETPPSLPEAFTPDVEAGRAVVAAAVAEGRPWLDPLEIGSLLAAYRIPVTPTVLAADADAAAGAATRFLAEHGSVAVKILSPDIVHKSDIGGVRLNLASEAAVREAAAGILARARAAQPSARIAGVTVQPMVVRPKSRELIAGIADDATFGPIVAFGAGGTAVEVVDDKALALPPLDLKLAHDLIKRTRVSRMLAAYRDVPAADVEAVALVLVKLAQLAADLPQVRELDLNPLLVDPSGVIVLDARVAVAPFERLGQAQGHPRFAVRPYPKEWERQTTLQDGTPIVVRPVRPEDEAMFREFFTHVTNDDLRLRFFSAVKDFSHAFIARLTQLDYARAMAFVAIETASGAMLGAVRLHADVNHDSAEYAILVRSDLKGKGLGWLLMLTMIDYARADGLQQVEGQVLRENPTMLAMCAKLGFHIEDDPDEPDLKRVTLPINATPVPP
jgi:acetyltransferase